MTNARDRSPYAGLALVLATLFGLLFWAGVAYAVIPRNWIIWPIAHGCGAGGRAGMQGATIKPVALAARKAAEGFTADNCKLTNR